MIRIGMAFALATQLVTAAQAQEWKIPSESKYLGTWSFDGSCASGDGMMLNKDGTAGYDEWGSGTWAETADGKRVILLLRTDAYTESDPYAVIVKELRIDSQIKDRLKGVFLDDGREIEGVLCPQA